MWDRLRKTITIVIIGIGIFSLAEPKVDKYEGLNQDTYINHQSIFGIVINRYHKNHGNYKGKHHEISGGEQAKGIKKGETNSNDMFD